MNFSKDLQDKINLLFQNNKDIREKLLSGDAEEIRRIGTISQKGISPEDIIFAFDSEDSDTMDYLYKKAKKMIELKQLYKDLCTAYNMEKAKKRIMKDKNGREN